MSSNHWCKTEFISAMNFMLSAREIKTLHHIKVKKLENEAMLIIQSRFEEHQLAIEVLPKLKTQERLSCQVKLSSLVCFRFQKYCYWLQRIFWIMRLANHSILLVLNQLSRMHNVNILKFMRKNVLF